MKRICILIILFMFQNVLAQEEIIPSAPKGFIKTGPCLQIWREEIIIEKPIMQVTIPVHMVIPVNSHFNLNFDYAYARTDWDMRHTSMGGFSDPYLQGNLLLWDNRLLIIGGIGVPLGKTRLNYKEYYLSTHLNLNIFNFKTPVYGQGFQGKIGALIAHSFSDNVVIGGGASYLYRRKFVPIYSANWANQGNKVDGYYDPGDETNVHLGLDLGFNEDMKVMLDGIFTFYQKDKYNSPQYVFQSGTKMTINLGYFYRYDEYYLWALLNYRSKTNNYALQGQLFKEEVFNSNSPKLDFNIIWKAFHIQGGGANVLVDGRFYGENEAGLSWAKALGGGFGGEYRFSYNTFIEFYIKYMVGQRISAEDLKKLNIEGMDVAILFRYEF
ncbi:hypothetical protein JW835_13785 [bacterium]|nr:hypothetical protein [bacterium]